MQDVLDAISLVITAIITWIGQFIGVITGYPLLLLFVVLSVTGIAVGFIRRLMRL